MAKWKEIPSPEAIVRAALENAGFEDGYKEAMADRIKELEAKLLAREGELKAKAQIIEELEAKLERISEEWASAVYGDLENGVASLNAAAATDFYKRYPSISSFGDTLQNILLEGEDRG